MEIEGKIIIVTGASKGIGLATAKLLGQKKAKVALAARSKDLLKKISLEIEDSFVVETDMRAPESISNMVQAVYKHYGRIDAVVNNAGQGIYGAIENIKRSEYQSVIDLNVLGPLTMMQEVIPIMRKQGGGRIVNISSMLSKMYIPYLGTYSSTKYALNSLSLTARAELEKENIIVNIVLPGLTATDFGKNAIKSDAIAKTLESRNRPDMPAPDSPEKVAERILYALTNNEAEIKVS